jgi:DNA-binding transcriptional MerR regulator
VYSRNEAARLTGVPVHKLRYWHNSGVYVASNSVHREWRYTALDVTRLKRVRVLVEAGFTVKAAVGQTKGITTA